MSRSRASQDGSIEEGRSDVTRNHSHGNYSKDASDPRHATNNSQAMSSIRREEVASWKNTAEEPEWYPVLHPKLPVSTAPRYFVNKRGIVCSNTTGDLVPLSQMKTRQNPSYMLYIDGTTNISLKLEEIMMHTFSSEHINDRIHYIFHKDGNQKNCAWDNLVLCDFAGLQELEIARLESLHPNTRYTVVRNIHDTLTFERYLVSDGGDIYSLIMRRHNHPANDRGVRVVYLSSDTGPEQTKNECFKIALHCVVFQSFNGRRADDRGIGHINHNRQDNSLDNLAYFTRPEFISRGLQEKYKKQQDIPKKQLLRPMPPVTEEMRWRTIGVLPWNGRSYSKYEVSDLGHVRRIGSSKLLPHFDNNRGHLEVSLTHDDQGLEAEDLSTAPRSFVQVSRLVAHAFVDGYSEVHNTAYHINEDLHDNRVQNLVWKDERLGRTNKKTRRVVVTLTDDPSARIEYPSIISAMRGLSISIYRYGIVRTSFKEEIEWNGEQKEALIEIV